MKKVVGLLGSEAGARALISCAGSKVGAADRPLISAIVTMAHKRVAGDLAAGDAGQAEKHTRSFLKPLRERRAVFGQVKELDVPAARTGPASFHCWLGRGVQGEKTRATEKSQRMLTGLSQWPIDWLTREGVVCYERALGRVQKERPGADGVPDEDFVQGLVKIWDLPTAVASAADHYVVLFPGQEPRHMRTSELARCFMIPAGSAMMPVLLGQRRIWADKWKHLSAVQAAECLGRCIHTGVARQIVRELIRRGLIGPGASYGSAFSGIDTFAAAVEAELEGNFNYVFASEKDKTVRAALLGGWERYGLEEAYCYKDACGDDAMRAPEVDIWVCSPTCESYSRKNHNKSTKAQNMALDRVQRCLRYVTLRRPKVVVMENVAEPDATGPITGLVSRLEGYAVEGGKLDPRTTAHAPMARERYFWILTRTDCQAGVVI